MKKYILYSLVVVSFLTSCESDITSLNNDPKNAQEIPSSFAFASGQYDLANALFDPGTQASGFPFLIEHQAETTYVTPSRFLLNSNSTNMWDRVYVRGLKMLDNSKNILSKEFDAGNEVGRNKLAMIEILSCYGFKSLVDTYGDIPYTEALQQENKISSPKYDDARTVYTALISRLDNAIGSITTSSGGYTQDFFYKGDMSKWKKLANSIKLSFGINLADVDPALSKKIVEEAYASGVMTSNADNAVYSYDGASYKNPYSVTREDIVASKILVDQLKQSNDPRLAKYFSTVNGNYVGGVFGNQNNYKTTSTFSASVSATTARGLFFDYSQVEFLLAEGAARGYNVGSAATHYKNAIAASMDYWGVAAADRDAYIAANPYNSAGNFKQQIGAQVWVSGYTNGYFVWNSIRRLNYPSLPVPPTSQLSGYPIRLPYPDGEQNLNNVNWTAAVSKIPGGRDVATAPVFWDKN
ncbi:SusD/RagB family nutrient-binding outer membrane lipoprotein [Elizabethkingia anophelis]|uniref:Starch-binding associating with outer membrane n=1 Tax=Elizabethkingia anophelis TaxID=1117645 RepID=A0A7Z7LX17_9FLAO|nr:SusD/RagB family nutrient-binding outer membrane lipoprotein [Elizabethkingia anophelis]MCT3629280.1 SusD/RagB family nutrient-binding outer membrane lipoprotein [Elizabethkingia anophelis]MCT3632873.1 SusD/RagB family nutrient-binding outer membrane lipoprotein [Elizabethkingia anophelis]MCT3691877.1 SusD/RagB family nutrient-binding outer membrane lipoprotein [Elizabethkingia anophelis]MCT3823343.1 SusD/RagB family nutrient-binding outer membrane lipoprotein [Elizabethkingia anophelis]MCT